jgi:hypothetical protein
MLSDESTVRTEMRSLSILHVILSPSSLSSTNASVRRTSNGENRKANSSHGGKKDVKLTTKGVWTWLVTMNVVASNGPSRWRPYATNANKLGSIVPNEETAQYDLV